MKKYNNFSKILFHILLFFSTNIFSQISFSEQLIIHQPTVFRPASFFTADIDGDGDLDVLTSSSDDSKIAWFPNLDGKGQFGEQRIISTSAQRTVALCVADLDGDGDPDVLSASSGDNKISWYENTDGNGSFSPENVVSDSVFGARTVLSADLDNDGDNDIIFCAEQNNDIGWFPNIDGKAQFDKPVIIKSSQIWNPIYMTLFDPDQDDDPDILFVTAFDSTVAWLENTDGKGIFGQEHPIAKIGEYTKNVALYAIDFDGDQDLDLISSFPYQLTNYWFENLDGKGTFGAGQALVEISEGVRSLFPADFDGDGDWDLLASFDSYNLIAWYENLDGKTNFSSLKEISTAVNVPSFAAAVDLDQDDDLDVISLSHLDNKIAWYENTDGQGTFGQQNELSSSVSGACSVVTADLDGDGDSDVVVAAELNDTIAWFENLDGQATFGPLQAISTGADGAMSVHVADLDSDGDPDVISMSYLDGKIAWYENSDGQANFGPEQIIATLRVGHLASILINDVDNDGDPDVVALSPSPVNSIFWYENTDGKAAFSTAQVITEDSIQPEKLYAADVDGDGDQDLLVDALGVPVLAWFENLNNVAGFGSQQAIRTPRNSTSSVYPTDLDGDGDLDLLAATDRDNEISWYENTNGLGTFGDQKVISASFRGASLVFAADFDADGDQDVLAGSERHSLIACFKNTDGLGAFGEQQEITTVVDGLKSLHVADLDGDGRLDILSASADDGKIAWYRNVSITNVEPFPKAEFQTFRFYQNYPNPFNPQTMLNFYLPEADFVTIDVFNLTGQKVAVLMNEYKTCGLHSFKWHTADLPAGLYFCRFQSGKYFEVRKLILQK